MLICCILKYVPDHLQFENPWNIKFFLKYFQHINDISLSIPLEDTLCKAEGIFLQLKEYKKLPKAVKEILGLLSVPISSSMENSMFMSSSSHQDVKSESATKVDTPTLMAGDTASRKSNVSINSSYVMWTSGGDRNSHIDEGAKIMS